MGVWERAQEEWDDMLEVSLFGEFKSALMVINDNETHWQIYIILHLHLHNVLSL